MLFPGHKGSVIVNKIFSANILSQPLKWTIQCCRNTVCPRSSDLFYIVSYYTEWVTTSWPYRICTFLKRMHAFTFILPKRHWQRIYIVNSKNTVNYISIVCPGSSDPFYIVTYYIKWGNTSWTHILYDWKWELEFFPPQNKNKLKSTPMWLGFIGQSLWII